MPGPQIESITLVDGNMSVTVAKSSVKISEIGPRGGTRTPTSYSPVELTRLIGLLQLAQDHQETFAAKQLGAGK